MFTPSRLKFARERLGLTAKEVAAVSGVSRESLSAYENGKKVPQSHALQSLAKTLEIPVTFLSGDPIESLNEEAVSFRARSKLTAGQRNAALAKGRLGVEFFQWIEDRFELPDPNVPTFPDLEPQTAAEAVRANWGLGNRPVGNMVHILEHFGVRVLRLPIGFDRVDAFSLQEDGTPYVFLNYQKTPERSRFDAAHELGHLVLHSEHKTPKQPSTEDAANRFAAAFLMPGDSVLAKPQLRNADSKTILKAKKIWGVSATALSQRLKELGMLTEWRYRDVFLQLQRAGYRTSEPDGMTEHETSQIMTQVFESLKAEGISIPHIASALDLKSKELRTFGIGLTPVTIEGVKIATTSETESTGRPPLRVVKLLNSHFMVSGSLCGCG